MYVTEYCSWPYKPLRETLVSGVEDVSGMSCDTVDVLESFYGEVAHNCDVLRGLSGLRLCDPPEAIQ